MQPQFLFTFFATDSHVRCCSQVLFSVRHNLERYNHVFLTMGQALLRSHSVPTAQGEDPMFASLTRAERAFLLLALTAFLGWSSSAYFAWSSRSLAHQVSSLAADYKSINAKYEALQSTAGELNALEAKLSAARMDYGRVSQASAETKRTISAAQQELASLTKRLEHTRDRASQTEGVRQIESTKRAAR
jgi:septal ring factor EnvC (AmiA/AmiB activator)